MEQAKLWFSSSMTRARIITSSSYISKSNKLGRFAANIFKNSILKIIAHLHYYHSYDCTLFIIQATVYFASLSLFCMSFCLQRLEVDLVTVNRMAWFIAGMDDAEITSTHYL